MNIRIATDADFEWLKEHDNYISVETLHKKVEDKHILIIYDSELIGWLRYGLFWDNIPFMNLIYLLEEYRGKGIGKILVEYWENSMKEKGYHSVITSTQSNESAQHFYRKIGYTDIGGFIIPGIQKELEILLIKNLTTAST